MRLRSELYQGAIGDPRWFADVQCELRMKSGVSVMSVYPALLGLLPALAERIHRSSPPTAVKATPSYNGRRLIHLV